MHYENYVRTLMIANPKERGEGNNVGNTFKIYTFQ